MIINERRIEYHIKNILKINPSHNRNLLRKGIIFMYNAHEGQVRISGKPYTDHSIAVGKYLAPQFSTIYVVSGYTHDIPEDTDITVEDIRAKFDNEIADIVDDMTQRFKESDEEYACRIINNKRAIPTRLGDRLHNIRTYDVFEDDKKQQILEETRDWLLIPAKTEFGNYRLYRVLEDEVYKRLEDFKVRSDRRYFLGKVASFASILIGSKKYQK